LDAPNIRKIPGQRACVVPNLMPFRSDPLFDVWEAIPTWETDLELARNYAFHVMDYIWASIPGLLQNLATYVKVEH
jgi:hypothetical protein